MDKEMIKSKQEIQKAIKQLIKKCDDTYYSDGITGQLNALLWVIDEQDWLEGVSLESHEAGEE